VYFDNITFNAEEVPVVEGPNVPIDFEEGGNGADWTWTVFENDDDPALEIIANPDASGANTSATVAKFTARAAGNPWAGVESMHGADLGTFTLDETNNQIKIMVWKSVISDVGIKLVASSGWAQPEIKVANTLVNQWEELTFDFSDYINPPDPELGMLDQIVIFPDYNLDGRGQENIVYFDNVTFNAEEVPVVEGPNVPIDFEEGGNGADWTWTVFENDDNPELEIIANPDASGINTSATVAKFTARAAGNPWAGVESMHGADLGTFTLDETNNQIKIMVWKSVISDVGIKLVASSGWAQPEIKVANTLVNQWEELTFDFSDYINPPDPELGMLDQIVIFPDYNLDGRGQENIVYFDNVTFNAEEVPVVEGPNVPIDFEEGGNGADWTWTVFENDDNPELEIIANPDASGINTSATVAKFTARAAGNPWAGVESMHGADLGTFVLDETNNQIKIMVWKSVISDVGIKLVASSGWAQPEIKVANTLVNQWEELTFDFSDYINPPDPELGMLDQIVIFPDYNLDGRGQENIVYFDNVTFNAEEVACSRRPQCTHRL
jgi:hypothetical protein